uniref:Uncharacterized protein n=1 Tax=Oryza punctata TaxID=4537 RepID=A0A0E0MLL3_ORYPU
MREAALGEEGLRPCMRDAALPKEKESSGCGGSGEEMFEDTGSDRWVCRTAGGGPDGGRRPRGDGGPSPDDVSISSRDDVLEALQCNAGRPIQCSEKND